MDYRKDRLWVEINLDALAHNVREIRKITSNTTEIMGVVKADAYGHGVEQVSRTILENGATRLGVASIDEALQLRRKGFDVPILILGYTDPDRMDDIVLNDITQTVFSLDYAQKLSQTALRHNKVAKAHVKIDTGMSRIGLTADKKAIEEILRLGMLQGINVEGIFTHFASADEKDKSFTYMQFEKFMDVHSRLEKEGMHIPVRHVSNSAGIMELPHMNLEMVRAGIILYGLYPSAEVDRSRLVLEPVMSFKARVSFVKKVGKDTCISYGRTFKTCRESTIATITAGYADGYSRLLSNNGRVIINGEIAPVVGRVCMDQFMADITGFRNVVRTGDEAVLFGRQGEQEISMDEIADRMGTITYEVACLIGKRVPRVYIKDGNTVSVINGLE